MWFRGAPALLCLAGCDVLFGMDHLPAPQDGPIPDAAPETVTAHAYARVVSNDVTRKPTVMNVEQSRVWKVQLDDGRDVPVTTAPDNTFSFVHAAGQRYRVFYDASTVRIEYQFAAPHLELGSPSWGRMDRDIPLPNTTLQYVVTNAGGVPGSASVYSTGIWTSSYVGPTNVASIDWTVPNSLFGNNGLIRKDKNDQVYFVIDQSVGPYVATTNYRVDDIMMAQGTTTTVSGMYMPLARDTCVHVTASEKAEALRVADVYGSSSAAFSASWTVKAIPAVDVGPDVGFLVASHGTAVGGAADDELDVMVGNPYPGYELVVGGAAESARNVQAGSATAATIYAGTATFVRAAMCPVASVLPTDTAVPFAIRVGGTALAMDGQSVTIDRSGLVPITWQVSPGAIGRYRIQLHEVVATAGRTTIPLNTEGWTDVTTFAVEPQRLTAGSTYVLYVVNEIGFTGADFKTVTYPWAQAFTPSTTFTIAN